MSRYYIEVGDLVRVVARDSINFNDTGLVTDVMEGNDGFNNFEVVFPHDRGWYQDVELRVINESR